MEPNVNSAPSVYNATYEHGVDEKRRLQIPSKWRPEQPGTEFTLVIWPQHTEGPCLRALPPHKMAELMREIDALPKGDGKKTTLKRLVGGDSAQVTLDSAGRICLPEELAKAAGITDKAVLVGVLDKFEIWNPDRHKRVKAADYVMAPEAFRMME